MKKIFATFCALVLMPMFSAQAWIGGPFSNNTYFGENGDDGVYEAVATGPNALGLYRIVVGNNFEGVNSSGTNTSAVAVNASYEIRGPGNPQGPGITENILISRPAITSGNVVIGAMGRPFNHMWFYEGIAYVGVSLRTASSTQGIVAGVGSAQQSGDLISRVSSLPLELRNPPTISSSFRAAMERSGPFIPSTAFSGTGRGRLSGDGIDPATNPPFRFLVFGSKVSSRILFGS